MRHLFINIRFGAVHLLATYWPPKITFIRSDYHAAQARRADPDWRWFKVYLPRKSDNGDLA